LVTKIRYLIYDGGDVKAKKRVAVERKAPHAAIKFAKLSLVLFFAK
jgi:hypothetical protein